MYRWYDCSGVELSESRLELSCGSGLRWSPRRQRERRGGEESCEEAAETAEEMDNGLLSSPSLSRVSAACYPPLVSPRRRITTTIAAATQSLLIAVLICLLVCVLSLPLASLLSSRSSSLLPRLSPLPPPLLLPREMSVVGTKVNAQVRSPVSVQVTSVYVPPAFADFRKQASGQRADPHPSPLPRPHLHGCSPPPSPSRLRRRAEPQPQVRPLRHRQGAQQARHRQPPSSTAAPSPRTMPVPLSRRASCPPPLRVCSTRSTV